MIKKNESNAIAIVGFVFSILAILTYGITSGIGLVLSIIGLIVSKKYSKGLKGLCIAGIIVSSIFVIVFWVCLATGVLSNSNVQTSKSSKTYGSNSEERYIDIPDFSSLNKTEVENWCNTYFANCEIIEEFKENMEPGKFISQSVDANTKIKTSESIEIVFSTDQKVVNTNIKSLSAISNKKLKENFANACNQIDMDPYSIKNLKKKDDWNSGPRYTFDYKEATFILYALDNGDVSSITIADSLLGKIYLDGYEPANVNDFIFGYDNKITLQVRAEEKLKTYIKYPSSAKFDWIGYNYTRRYDIYQIVGTFKAKNALGEKIDHKFQIEFKKTDDGFDIVYLNVNGEKYIGSSSQLKNIELKELQVQEQKTGDDSFILKDGVLGTYGKKDKFDGEDYIRYYIPTGKYEVEALTKNAQFFVETIALHKEDGWDAATTIQQVKLPNSGDKTEITVSNGECISLVAYTQIKLKKID